MQENELVLVCLRRATADLHRDIEQLLGLDGEFDRMHYARVVAGFEAFLSAWEPAVYGALPGQWRGWFTSRSRRPLVLRDLAALNVEPARMPALASQGLRFTSPDAAFGSLYVVEGSALGGQVIAARAARSLGITPDSGGAYFAGWGKETAARWREFCVVLESEAGPDPTARAAACDAAVITFEALHATFQQVLDEAVAC